MQNSNGPFTLTLIICSLLLINHWLPTPVPEIDTKAFNPDPVEAQIASGKTVGFCSFDEASFTLIPGLGKVLALRLSDFQKSYCPAACVSGSTLDSIHGIGPKLLITLGEYITIDESCRKNLQENK